jgi:hypothetical protein
MLRRKVYIEPFPNSFAILLRFRIFAHLRRKTPQTGLSATILDAWAADRFVLPTRGFARGLLLRPFSKLRLAPLCPTGFPGFGRGSIFKNLTTKALKGAQGGRKQRKNDLFPFVRLCVSSRFILLPAAFSRIRGFSLSKALEKFLIAGRPCLQALASRARLFFLAFYNSPAIRGTIREISGM